MRIWDCEFENRRGLVEIQLRSMVRRFAIRNPKFEIYVVA